MRAFSSHFIPFAVTSFSGEVLKLSKLSRSDMGSFLCIASNGNVIFEIEMHSVFDVAIVIYYLSGKNKSFINEIKTLISSELN